MNDWLEKYKINMDCRYSTFKKALDLLLNLNTHNIVETGCVRLLNDWGAGYSTVLFGEFCKNSFGKVTSVDNWEPHINISKNITSSLNFEIQYVLSDSVEYLKNYKDTIDLLYLDSLDVPLGENDDRSFCQTHNLNEFIAAEDKLHSDSIVLIDDYFGGDGKGKLTEVYLLNRGWKLVDCNQQQLFIKTK